MYILINNRFKYAIILIALTTAAYSVDLEYNPLCGPLSLSYILETLQIDYSSVNLIEMTKYSPDKGTQLNKLKEAAENFGLQTLILKGRVKSIVGELDNRTLAILAESQHFVVLELTDKGDILRIDCTTNSVDIIDEKYLLKEYYALLISNKALNFDSKPRSFRSVLKTPINIILGAFLITLIFYKKNRR